MVVEVDEKKVRLGLGGMGVPSSSSSEVDGERVEENRCGWKGHEWMRWMWWRHVC